MTAGLVQSVAGTLLYALQNQELGELCSMFGYQSQLAVLECSVDTIKSVLLDAESKHQELNNQGKDWLGKLKDAVYDADDLFDEFITVAQQQKRMPGGKISKKVRRFFSSNNQLLFAIHTSRKIKKLREKLDSIAKDRTQFGISDVYVPNKKREETISYVHDPSIIGRDADKEAIVELLLREPDSSVNDQDHVSFVSIVGIGGLGKTALAQIVFRDERIKRKFELSMWVCVSEEFGMKEILTKMLDGEINLTIEALQMEVRRKIEGKKFFLALDDVWEEDRYVWANLRDFLLLGARGSRIIVTSRSEKVAKAIGDYPIHKLQGLSDEDSWLLFERFAFNKSREWEDEALVDIGKDIVKKCANVPLSIRVIGSMLNDQDKSLWLSFRTLDLAEMAKGKDVMSILKFSYYHLTSSLKSCFSYCALFPKGDKIPKSLLISLWIAEGCIEQPNDVQNVEDVGEECFSILLNRCFFQHVDKDPYGGIYGVQMHDLIHDLAQDVAGTEMCFVKDASISNINNKCRHVSILARRPSLPSQSDALSKLKTMRTLIRPSHNASWEYDVILGKCKRLRVLDLHFLNIKTLGNTLKNLLHLRYLNLGENYNLERLPQSISKLYNLQTLILNGCLKLKELPENLRELVNLRELAIKHCHALTHMPIGMGSLTKLRSLTMFVVAGGSLQAHTEHLKELKPLINLTGELRIKFKNCCSYDPINAENGRYVVNMKNVKYLAIEAEIGHPNKERMFVNKRLLEDLEPHPNLRNIEIKGYKDIDLPVWLATLATSFLNLVSIFLAHFHKLEHLPNLCQLQHLKNLELGDMPHVDYIEDYNDGVFFFPSLESMVLFAFPNLKGWWRELRVKNDALVPSFPCLNSLVIRRCPNLTTLPRCPHVKSFMLHEFNEALTFSRKREEASIDTSVVTPSDTACNESGELVFDVERLHLDNVWLLNSLFGESSLSIRHLSVERSDVEGFSTVVERYAMSASSIQTLAFLECARLKSLWKGGIEHLTNLHNLGMKNCPNLDLNEEEDGMQWELSKLSSMVLDDLPKVVKLPKGFQYLSSLRSLVIIFCRNLEGLPEWLDCLKSLTELVICGCPKLISLPDAISRLPSLTTLHIQDCVGLWDRCRGPDGEDFLKIRHISNLVFLDYPLFPMPDRWSL